MKIWVIGRSYPNKKNNMQGSFELEQAKMLKKYGHEVAYISCVFHPYKKIRKWGITDWEEDGIKIYTNSVPFFPERVKINLLSIKSYFWKKLFSCVEKDYGLPDVIHVHYPTNITVFKNVLSFKSKGVKIICTEHWSRVLLNKLKNYERKQLLNYLHYSDSFICVSEILKKSILDNFDNKFQIDVIPNMINPMFMKDYNTQNINFEHFRFIAIGNQVKIKQFDKILESFKKFNNLYANSELIFVGGGPEHNNLIELSKRLNISEKVHFKGSLSRKDTAYELSKANVLISYSLYETFGVPIIESWSLGKPVICSNSVGVVSKWNDQFGVQVSPTDSKQLINAMKLLFENYNEFNANFLKNYARNNFSEESIYKQLIKKYLE